MENEILKETPPVEESMPELNMGEREEPCAAAVPETGGDTASAEHDEKLAAQMESLPTQMRPEDMTKAVADLSDQELAELLQDIPTETLSNALTNMQTKTKKTKHKFQKSKVDQTEYRVAKAVVTTVISMISMVLTAVLLVTILLGTGVPTKTSAEAADEAMMDRYDMYMTNEVSNALDGVLSIEKVYWLNDDDLIAPEPNAANYGSTDDPTTLQGLLDEARELLEVDEILFSTDVEIRKGTEINYYLDETIFAITWEEVRHNCAYTFAEVKIAHPSQFRRFLAGGTYGSDKQFITTQMASDVNAVLASSGDFYKFRNYGTIVYDGVVKRINSTRVDTCFIDDKGDLIFTYAGEITTMEEAQKFVDDNNIRFSIAFGPVLVDNGQRCEPYSYPIGEINDRYARAGLAQMGELHYLVVTANRWQSYDRTPTIHDFAQVMLETGCEKAYTLDGGQTGVIALGGEMMNPAQYGSQRLISDIFYFATALPDGD